MLKQACDQYNENTKEKYRDKEKENVDPTDLLLRTDDVRRLGTFAFALLVEPWIEAIEDSTEEERELMAVGDKTPEHALQLPLLHSLMPGMKAVHIIRDGRDAAVSGWFHNLRSNPAFSGEQKPSFQEYVQLFARDFWTRYIQKARGFGEKHPDQYYELHYEDLKSHPRGEIRDLLEFLELPADDRTVEICEEAGAFETITGGRKTGEEDSDSFFRKGVAGDWKHHFDEADLTVFNRYAGDLMKELGYHS